MNYFNEEKDLKSMDIYEFHDYFKPLYNKYYDQMRDVMVNKKYEELENIKIDFKKVPERLQFEKQNFTDKCNFVSEIISKKQNIYLIDKYVLFLEDVLKFIDYTVFVYESFSMYYKLISPGAENDQSIYDIYLDDANNKSDFINNLVLDYVTDLSLINEEKLQNFHTMLLSEFNDDFLKTVISNIFN